MTDKVIDYLIRFSAYLFIWCRVSNRVSKVWREILSTKWSLGRHALPICL